MPFLTLYTSAHLWVDTVSMRCFMDLPQSQTTVFWSSKETPFCCSQPLSCLPKTMRWHSPGSQNEMGREDVAEERIKLKFKGYMTLLCPPCSKGKVSAEVCTRENTLSAFLTAVCPLPFQTLWELGIPDLCFTKRKGPRGCVK